MRKIPVFDNVLPRDKAFLEVLAETKGTALVDMVREAFRPAKEVRRQRKRRRRSLESEPQD